MISLLSEKLKGGEERAGAAGSPEKKRGGVLLQFSEEKMVVVS